MLAATLLDHRHLGSHSASIRPLLERCRLSHFPNPLREDSRVRSVAASLLSEKVARQRWQTFIGAMTIKEGDGKCRITHGIYMFSSR